jgi:pyruvate/2-oxoglutarate dehydrogenase complex dihydrolipoamide dehydrogenase (E3) component
MDSKDFGWDLSVEKDIKHDWKKLIKKVSTYTSKLNWKYEGGLRNNKVEYLHCIGSFIDNHTVNLKFDDENLNRIVTSKYVLISTGTRPKFLNEVDGFF